MITDQPPLMMYAYGLAASSARPVRPSEDREWLFDDRWDYGVWPNAAAIDTPLPVPPEYVHLMLDFKPEWVQLSGDGPRFGQYPELSIADWHKRHGLTQPRGGP